MKFGKDYFRPAFLCTVVTMGSIIMMGCSSEKGAADTSTKVSAPHGGQQGSEKPATVVAKRSRSVFKLDEGSRDPFHPRSKKAVAQSTLPTGVVERSAEDIPALLSAGLQGILGTAEKRMALINNVLLEAGRPAVIPVMIGNQSRSIAVRCREVTRTSVIVDVEGYGPLVIARKQTL